MFHPMFGPFRFGRIGDGAVQLDEASLQPGGLVRGRFDGIVNYYVCVKTVAPFFQPPPEAEAPTGEGTETTDEPPPAEPPPADEPPPEGP